MAQLELTDFNFPVEVTLEAFNPLIPADVEVNSLPDAMLRY